MLSRGLMNFIQQKSLKGSESINAFLKYKGITSFTAKNQYKADDYIQQNWNEWATFIDKSLKNGTISGKRVKMCHYYDEQREEKRLYDEQSMEELRTINKHVFRYMNEVAKLNRRLGESSKKWGYVQAFISKNNLKLPKVNQDALHPLKRWEPKIISIIKQGKGQDLINFLKKSLENLELSKQ